MAETACDLCGRTMHWTEPCYVATIDIRPTTGLLENDEDPGDRDHLLELHESLEALEADVSDLEDLAGPAQEMTLCQDCCRRFREHPLSHDVTTHLEFSEN